MASTSLADNSLKMVTIINKSQTQLLATLKNGGQLSNQQYIYQRNAKVDKLCHLNLIREGRLRSSLS